MTKKANNTGSDTAVVKRLNRKKQPKKISSNAIKTREALLGRKDCVLKVNTILKMPENSVSKPITQAADKSVMSGLTMQTTPSAMSRRPEMQSQIFLPVFMI